jgi:RHS repeat-associated protein
MFVPNPAGATLQPIVYYVHTDHLDTPRALLDTAGNLRWTWLAEPFGNTAPNANPAGLGAVTMNLRHPGQYADAESGLFYNYFRDYDPSLGRYTQSDPIGLAGGINTYAYLISDQPQQAHSVSQWDKKMGAFHQEMRHANEPSPVPEGPVDAGVP